METAPRLDDDDAALLTRSAAGDRRAFDAFMGRYAAQVFRYARSLVRSDADAEDVLQQTFLAAWKSAAQARPSPTAKPWLFTIARHNVHRLGRRRVGEPAPGELADIDDVAELGARAGFATDESPEVLVQRLEQRAALQAALAQLSDVDREVLWLRDVEGLSGPEVAAVIGTALEATKARLHRARLRLTAALRAGGGQ